MLFLFVLRDFCTTRRNIFRLNRCVKNMPKRNIFYPTAGKMVFCVGIPWIYCRTLILSAQSDRLCETGFVTITRWRGYSEVEEVKLFNWSEELPWSCYRTTSAKNNSTHDGRIIELMPLIYTSKFRSDLQYCNVICRFVLELTHRSPFQIKAGEWLCGAYWCFISEGAKQNARISRWARILNDTLSFLRKRPLNCTPHRYIQCTRRMCVATNAIQWRNKIGRILIMFSSKGRANLRHRAAQMP